MNDSIPQKCCPGCNRTLPVTSEYFGRDKHCKSKFTCYCKECRHKQFQQSYVRKRPLAQQGYKVCSYCQQEKPASLEFFPPQKTGADGLNPVCRGCYKAYQAELARKRMEAMQGTMRTCNTCGNSFPATPEFFYRDGAALRHECKHCKNKTRMKHYKANEDTYKQNRKQRYVEDPQKVLVHTRNRTARIRKNGGRHTSQDIALQYERQKGKCYYCKKRLGQKYHVDHVIPLNRGGSNDPSNLVIACHSCNESKRDKMLHEWPQGGRLL